ncbi:MAG: cysteine desulfurase [Planctomycetes bacterium]|nr:cysteine desulfurase [Planctomycetota bacterium]
MTSAAHTAPANEQTYDVHRIKADFPILAQQVHGHPLVYLDNAATTQKPRAVISALEHYYAADNANIHRGVHELSGRATKQYEEARAAVRAFLNAADDREIIFVRGATEGINLVADSFGRSFRAGDEIIVSTMEHHSNIVPWQMLCERSGAVLKVVPIDDDGEFLMDEYEKLLSPRTRMVGIVHQSNSLGTVNPVKETIARAHAAGARVLVDGAQAAPHQRLDVRALDTDFYVLSGHKMYGPTGIGVLYGKRELLESMPPYQGGGDMILSVSFEKTVYNKLPYKFEAGTPHIAGPIGLKAAIDYMQAVGLERIAAHEHELLAYGCELLAEIPGLRMIGTAAVRSSVLSFVLEGIHPHDIGTILDREGIAIRTGHHCAQPVMARYGVPATARASLAMYNSRSDVEALARGLRKTIEVFS